MSMRLKFSLWSIVIAMACVGTCISQSSLPTQNPADPQQGGHSVDLSAGRPSEQATTGSAKVAIRLSIQDAEGIALKSNPAISEARLIALASQQVTREVRSSLWPQAYANMTAVDARNNSRITAGGLNNPIIYTRAAGGATVSQLITDFGHTTNLVRSARLQASADEQHALATKEDMLLAVDQAFYNALQTHAVLRVAEQTVASRQLLSDQVSALTRSKLKSELDLSFANVNLAQAKLLYLDALNNDKAAVASLSAILGYPSLEQFELINDPQPLAPPPADVDPLIADAFAKRPEILALEFESESVEKLHLADRDQMFPTISALAAYGDSPVRDDRVYGPYAAVGVNLQIPIFNGFLFSAKSRETDLRAQAMRQRLADIRNRISRDVRTSWLTASTAFDRVTVSEQLLAQANQALDLAQTRYKLGLSSIVELSQAQLQQTQAEIGSAQAGFEYRLALSVLRYQTTGL
ncbi:MAG TPA: TolC family protein [Candidatus Dormibacteraeota bacterium]|nr:TolC family protein [Candidatus Dormibacteraeota bacterium]